MHEMHSGANDIIEDVPADPESKNPRQDSTSRKPEALTLGTWLPTSSPFERLWETRENDLVNRLL